MMRIRVTCGVFIMSLLYINVFGQIQKLKRLSIGDKIPTAQWKQLTGGAPSKLLILDFWSTGCTSCMEAFPRMEKLQSQFNGKLEVVLINPWENDDQIKERLSKMNIARVRNETELFTLPVSLKVFNGDTVYRHLFQVRSVPHHVWINDKGIVQYITWGHNAAAENVQLVLEGKRVNMDLKDDADEIQAKVRETGYIQPSLKTIPLPFYSAFIPYYNVGISATNWVDSVKGVFRMSNFNLNVIDHFKFAYLNGKKERVILEMKNHDQYRKPDYDTEGYLIDDWMRKYAFTYDFQSPFRERDKWQSKMQQDVNYFFGNLFNIEGGIEKRTFNSLILVKFKGNTISQAHSELSNKAVVRDTLLIFENQEFGYFADVLAYKLEDMSIGRPFLDETEIDPNLKVNVKLMGNLKDVENVRKQLQQYGFDIIEAAREVEVLVIRDKL